MAFRDIYSKAKARLSVSVNSSSFQPSITQHQLKTIQFSKQDTNSKIKKDLE